LQMLHTHIPHNRTAGASYKFFLPTSHLQADEFMFTSFCAKFCEI
jgi:hypothetical protein